MKIKPRRKFFKVLLLIFWLPVGVAYGQPADWNADWNADIALAKYSLGLGLQSSMENQVNPDFVDIRSIPLLFAKLQVDRWGFLSEVGREAHSSSSGSLAITSRTFNIALWGRHDLGTRSWTPFVAAGLGVNFDKIQTSFQSSAESRSGIRPLAGLGFGLSASAWRYLLVEAEVRIEAVQERVGANFSTVLRSGVNF